VIVHFVDIGGIVYHHFLNFLIIISTLLWNTQTTNNFTKNIYLTYFISSGCWDCCCI